MHSAGREEYPEVQKLSLQEVGPGNRIFFGAEGAQSSFVHIVLLILLPAPSRTGIDTLYLPVLSMSVFFLTG